MEVHVVEHHQSDLQRTFSGLPEEVRRDLFRAYPWLGDRLPKASLEQVVEKLNRGQAYSAWVPGAVSILPDSGLNALIDHPNPKERAMALLLEGVNAGVLERAAQDPDPTVYTRAFDHPKFDTECGTRLMESCATQQQLAFLQHPKLDAEHLYALYDSAQGPDAETLRGAMVGSPLLPGELAQQMYDDPSVSFPVRLQLMQHPNMPVEAIQHAIKLGLMAPGEGVELAKKAIHNPNTTMEMVERLVRIAAGTREAHQHTLADYALRNRPVSRGLIHELFMLAKMRPELHPLCAAACANPAATPMDQHEYLSSLVQPKEPVQKSESDNLDLAEGELSVIRDMLGYQVHLTEAFQAAAFLSGNKGIPFERVRRALYLHEGDLEAAALVAFGYDPNDENRAALRSVMALETVQKAEPVALTAQEVMAPHPEGQMVAQSVSRAFKDSFVFPVQLSGKHSKGSMLARDEANGITFLLKPGSGHQSSAAGADQEKATQSAREAAFYQVAHNWGLENWFPRAELLIVDGKEYAAMQLLPWTFKTLQAREAKEPDIGRKVLHPMWTDGTLHKLGALDFILGNSDRHLNNLMLNKDGELRLIDHGSAFAGAGFDPANDDNSFVPAYLRAWSPKDFNQLPKEKKLASLPVVSQKVDEELGEWLESLDPKQLEDVMGKYGISPSPTIARFLKLKELAHSVGVSRAVNSLWVTV